MNKLTVLIVHNSYMLSGGEDTVVKNEINLLKKHGYRVLFYHRDNNEIKGFSLFRKLGIPLSMFFSPKTYCDIKHIIKKENVDLVHVHNTLNLIGPAVYYAAMGQKIPVVQTIHNFRFLCPNGILFRDGKVCEECIEKGMQKAVIHGCYRGSRIQTLIYVVCFKLHNLFGIYGKLYYICLTEFNKIMLLKLKSIPEEQVFVKGNFVNRPGISAGLQQRKNQYVFVGRLEKLKGIIFLLKAWRQFQARHSDSQLILLGNGPLENWCDEYIKKHNLHVVRKGHVEHDEVLKTVSDSKALLFSTECYEGLPISILEAFSVGTPVVCADFGNAGNLVTAGVTGEKYQKGSIPSFLAAMEKIDVNYIGMVEACEKEFQTKYLPENNYLALDQIYQRVREKLVE